jgi:hypothetical protein
VVYVRVNVIVVDTTVGVNAQLKQIVTTVVSVVIVPEGGGDSELEEANSLDV